jgi:hypothetical protein
MVTGIDVYDRHVLEAELRAGERRLRDVIDTMFDAVAVLSPVPGVAGGCRPGAA